MSDGQARLRWALSVNGLIGLLAVLPAFGITTGAVDADSDIAAIFCLLWVFKLGLYAPAMETLSRVISNERATLASVLIIFVIVLVSAATATHLLERIGQPDAFGSVPASLWWAVVTLTTTGYGDVVPHSVGGKMIGSVVMVSGIVVLALMTGILATGFAEEERRREYLRVWDQVTKVPMFTALGTVTLSEIVGKLRVRHYPPRIVVVRRDEPGDSMFFISEGEVEVRLPRASVRLGQGGFFGEMALLTRLPRSATVVTTHADHAARALCQRLLRDRRPHSLAGRGGRARVAAPAGRERRQSGQGRDNLKDTIGPAPAVRVYRRRMSLITPVILVGGSGKRLWPLSRESMPKQFVPLLGKQSTFQQTLLRVADREPVRPAGDRHQRRLPLHGRAAGQGRRHGDRHPGRAVAPRFRAGHGRRGGLLQEPGRARPCWRWPPITW